LPLGCDLFQRLQRLVFVQCFNIHFQICVDYTYRLSFWFESVHEEAKFFALSACTSATVYNQYLAVCQRREIGSQMFLKQRLPVLGVVASFEGP
jgi:hypothetical protein